MARNPFFFDVPMNGKVQIVNADASGLKTVTTAATAGSKVTSVNAQSTDTSDRDVQIGISSGGTFYPLGTLAVPAGSGNSGTVNSVNMLDPAYIQGLSFDNDGNPYLLLVSGDTLQVKSLTSVTAAKTITVIATQDDASA